MDEIISATSGESSTPTTDVGAAGAGGSDANVSTESTAQAGTESAERQDEGLSPGWSLDDIAEETAETAADEITDEILQEYLSDPRLDPQKGDPAKLVADLKGARAERNAARAEIAQLKQQIAQLDQFGGLDGINRMTSLGLNKLMANPKEGSLDFVSTLAKQSTPAYWEILNTYAQHAPDDVMEALQRFGHVPQEPAQRTGQIDNEILSTVPEHLRDLYLKTPLEVRDEYDLATPAARNYALEQQYELSQLKGAERQRAEAEQKQKADNAKAEGDRLVREISDQFGQAHHKQLSKWQPFGPDGATQNEFLYKVIINGAFASLMEDPKFGKMYQDTLGYLKNAPTRRLQNEAYAADEDEREGRALAARFNTALGNKMKELIKHPEYGFESAFSDARKWREYQRSLAPPEDRKEIPGTGTTGLDGNQRDSGQKLSPDEAVNRTVDNLKQRLRNFVR